MSDDKVQVVMVRLRDFHNLLMMIEENLMTQTTITPDEMMRIHQCIDRFMDDLKTSSVNFRQAIIAGFIVLDSLLTINAPENKEQCPTDLN